MKATLKDLLTKKGKTRKYFQNKLERTFQDYKGKVKLMHQAFLHEIKRHLLLGRKVMTHLESILKSRDITLSTKST